MTTIKLSEDGTVLTFDGNVLEVFYSGDSDHRIHVTWLERIEIKTDRKGKHSISRSRKRQTRLILDHISNAPQPFYCTTEQERQATQRQPKALRQF